VSILDILVKAGGAAASLLSLLLKVKTQFPDLADEVDSIVEALNQVVDPANLIALAESLPKELANIAQGDLDPRRHPSDVA
jgi:hypothetical protein